MRAGREGASRGVGSMKTRQGLETMGSWLCGFAELGRAGLSQSWMLSSRETTSERFSRLLGGEPCRT